MIPSENVEQTDRLDALYNELLKTIVEINRTKESSKIAELSLKEFQLKESIKEHRFGMMRNR